MGTCSAAEGPSAEAPAGRAGVARGGPENGSGQRGGLLAGLGMGLHGSVGTGEGSAYIGALFLCPGGYALYVLSHTVLAKLNCLFNPLHSSIGKVHSHDFVWWAIHCDAACGPSIVMQPGFEVFY